MIEPMMATMLGFVTTDAALPPRAARSGAARGRRRHVQRHHRRRRVLDQRLRDAAGQRRERRRPVDEASLRRVRPRAESRLPPPGPRHRAGWRRRHQARHGDGHRRRLARRGPDGSEGHRQLAARENGHPRRRPELGTADRGRRAAQASRSSWRAPRSRSVPSCSSRTAGRTTRRRPKPRRTCRTARSPSRCTWVPAARRPRCGRAT